MKITTTYLWNESALSSTSKSTIIRLKLRIGVYKQTIRVLLNEWKEKKREESKGSLTRRCQRHHDGTRIPQMSMLQRSVVAYMRSYSKTISVLSTRASFLSLSLFYPIARS